MEAHALSPVRFIHTTAEVFEWALANGFHRVSDQRVECIYFPGVVVAIAVPGKRNLIVTLEIDNFRPEVIGRFRPTRGQWFYINDWGVLEGIGLSQAFVLSMHYRKWHAVPPWFTREYANLMLGTIGNK
jgi:hypothetical protein